MKLYSNKERATMRMRIKEQCIFRVNAIVCKTQKYYDNVAKKNKDESVSVSDEYIGIYSTRKNAEKAIMYYLDDRKYNTCSAGFEVTMEYLDDPNHVREFGYEPDLTIIYDSKGKYITELEGHGKSKDLDCEVYFGCKPERITLKKGDFVMYRWKDAMHLGVIIGYPATEKEWKKRRGDSGSNDYEASYLIATDNGYDHPFITEVFPSVVTPSKKKLLSFRKGVINWICRNQDGSIDWKYYNKKYKKIFDKLLKDK